MFYSNYGSRSVMLIISLSVTVDFVIDIMLLLSHITAVQQLLCFTVETCFSESVVFFI